MKKIDKWIIGLLIASLLLTAFNTTRLSTIEEFLSTTSFSQVSSSGTSAGASESLSGVLPTGVPAIYGAELGVSFDDVTAYDAAKADATITRMANIDRNLEVEGADRERYIRTLYELNGGISCEYCCGAKSIIFENGKSACGCAHSYAMRGLAKYLITEHGDEYTNEEIQEEVAKWKVLYFPTQMQAKAAILKEKGVELSFQNLGSNTYRGIEQGASGGGMVGGC